MSSCASVAAHLACVERRLQRLANIGVESDIDRAASEFVLGIIKRLCQELFYCHATFEPLVLGFVNRAEAPVTQLSNYAVPTL